MAITWGNVIADPRWQPLSFEERDERRMMFWERIAEPTLRSDSDRDNLLSEFLSRTQSDLGETREGFDEWYGKQSAKLGLHPDPDYPEHFYDYRAAYQAGSEPDETGHFPSAFKLPGHPTYDLKFQGGQVFQEISDVSFEDLRKEARPEAQRLRLRFTGQEGRYGPST